MGIVSSLLEGFYRKAEVEEPDPVTGLTAKEVRLVQTSFGVIRKQIPAVGVDLLLKLFERYPEDQHRFPYFANALPSELKRSKKFKAHCSTVMYSLSQIVDNLQEGEIVVEILLKIGQNHKRNKVPSSAFWNLKVVLMETLKTIMKAEEVEAWDKALNVAFGVIGKVLDS